MRYVLKLCVSLSILLTAASPATSAFIIDPISGSATSFSWTSPVGTGFSQPVDFIGNVTGNEATVTLAESLRWNVRIADCCITGDAFALALNGNPLTPVRGNIGSDTRGPLASSFFVAEYAGLRLPAGQNVFTVFITDACCSSGDGDITFTPVPLPAAAPMLGAALFGLGVWSRRRRHV